MGVTTHIVWCDSTLNWWEGCTKVSPGCANCYAESRYRSMMIEPVIHWGKGAPRRKSKSAVQQALILNRKPFICDYCGKAYPATMHEGKFEICPDCFHSKDRSSLHRRRIFSLSLGDWLDPEVPVEWLTEMLDTIRQCNACDWLLLTKRPELFAERMQRSLRSTVAGDPEKWLCDWMDGNPPHNIWIGTSVEDQKRADERIPHLLKIPARVRFLSVEPILEQINLGFSRPAKAGGQTMPGPLGIHQVIVGGESGKNARPCNIEWLRSIKAQCESANTAFFCKQLGSNPVECESCGNCDPCVGGHPEQCAVGRTQIRMDLNHPKGGDPDEWLEDLRVRQFPIL